MKEIKAMKENALKQALERRQTGRLPSNFQYRTMKRVHCQATRQRRRRGIVEMIAPVIAAFFLIGMGVYFLVFHLKFSLVDAMPRMDVEKEAPLFCFYFLIAILALLLLAIDYWLRKKYIERKV